MAGDLEFQLSEEFYQVIAQRRLVASPWAVNVTRSGRAAGWLFHDVDTGDCISISHVSGALEARVVPLPPEVTQEQLLALAHEFEAGLRERGMSADLFTEIREALALLPLLAGAAGATGNDDWMEQADAAYPKAKASLARLEREAAERETALAEMEERWLGMCDCYDREVRRVGEAEARVREVEAELKASILDAGKIITRVRQRAERAEATVARLNAEFDRIDGKTVESLNVANAHLRATVARQAETLQLADDTICKLAEQQAMDDDWYEAPLASIRAVLASPEAASVRIVHRDPEDDSTTPGFEIVASPEAAAAEPRKTREAWITERVERYAGRLCPAFWHNEGHSSHSTCPSCDGTFMRGEAIATERRRLEHFASRAEAYALDVDAAALPAVDAPPVGWCSGARDCDAETHVHGCFADTGNCDEPNEHNAAVDAPPEPTT